MAGPRVRACFLGVFPFVSRLVLGAVEASPHLAAVALQGGFLQRTAGDAGDQFDHRGADFLMLPAAGIAKADDLHPLSLLEDSVVPPVNRNVGPGGIHELNSRGRATGGEKAKQDQGDELFHRRRMAEVG